VRNPSQYGHRVLGAAIHFALPAFSGSPNSSRGLANGSLGRLPGASRFFLGALSRHELRGGCAFLGRQFTSRLSRSLATPIHRAVAQPGHGFVARFIVGWSHFSPVQVAFLSVWHTLVLWFDDLGVSLLSSGQVAFLSV
jgi:hypothetical protein